VERLTAAPCSWSLEARAGGGGRPEAERRTPRQEGHREGVTGMGKADCDICETLGYRSCDRCGGILFTAPARTPLGLELCADCR